MRVLCAGDRFITPQLLADAVRREAGGDVDMVEYATTWPDEPFGPVDGVLEASGDVEELAALAADVDAVLTHLAPISRRVLESATRLRVVGVTRGGPVNVALAAATERGVPVLHLPGRNLGAVAEFTLGLMLALPRGVTASSRALSGGTWDARWFRFDVAGPELRASTVGLVGLGAVGLRVAELLRAFGARVVAYDPFADPARAAAAGVDLLPLPTVLGCADIVSVHARLTDETRRMFDRDAFAAMKPGAYFVNTARGELVDQPALLEALESGHLAGAALDVFDPEPPAAADPLLQRADVVATPHLAGSSRQVALESADRVAAQVAAFLRDGTVDACANPDWSRA